MVCRLVRYPWRSVPCRRPPKRSSPAAQVAICPLASGWEAAEAWQRIVDASHGCLSFVVDRRNAAVVCGRVPRGHRGMSAPALLERKIFPGIPSSVREVRCFLRDVLGADHPVLDRLEVCASELVTNALCHTESGRGGQVLVAVDLRADRLRVYVVDEGGASTEPRVRRSGFAESGHGLHLVEELSDGWRTQLEDEGRTTWFDIAL
jgi:anti-sigma regulatory factor (Ser/Thr protein kinase)